MNKFLHKLIVSVIRMPLVFLILLGLIYIGSLIQLKELRIDNSLDIWFLKNDPILVNHRYFQKEFGNDETIAIVFSDPETIMTSENKKRVKEITEKIEALKDVKRVISFSNIPNKLFLVSDDKRTTALFVELESLENMDEKRPLIINEVKEVLDAIFKHLNIEYHLAGIGITYNALNEISLKDSMLFIGFSYLIIFILLAFVIRDIRFILLSFFIMFYCLTVTMGIFVLFGRSINMVTMVIPSLITIFSVSDIIHLTHSYRKTIRENRGLSKKELVVKAVFSVGVPCFLTSLTTALGFSSLIISRIQIIKDLGLFTAVGVLLTFFFSFCLATCGFLFLPLPKGVWKKRVSLVRLFNLIMKRKKAILLVSLACICVLLPGLFRIRIDTYSIQLLKVNHPVRIDSDYIEKNFGFYTPLEILIKTKTNDLLDPEIIRGIESFRNELEAHPLVSRVITLHTFAPLLSRANTREGIQKIINKIPGKFISSLVTSDYKVVRLSGRVKMLSASGFKEIITEIEVMGKETFSSLPVTIEPSGYLPMYVKMMEYISKTQISSSLLAFIVIFTIFFIYTSSFKLAFFSFLANLFPILFILGFMGWFGIPLDIATVTIAAISIGVVVDDTIHFIHRLKTEEKKNLDKQETVKRILQQVGSPIASTSLVLALGYSVLILAQVKSILYFGLLSSLVILMALVGDLFILPSLYLISNRKRSHERDLKKTTN